MALSASVRASYSALSSPVVDMTAHYPGSKGGEAVEIGVDKIWLEFDGFGSSQIITCADAPGIAMCASTTIENGRNEPLWSTTESSVGATTMRCWNASSIGLSRPLSGGVRAWVDLSADKIADFDATTTVVMEEGVFCGNQTRKRNAFATWTFRTVSAPEVPEDAMTANTTVTTKKYSVYGLGVFLNDVATIDISAGTFYGDLSIYALRYYRTFVDPKTALEEATVKGPRSDRECAMQSGDLADKWLLLKRAKVLSTAPLATQLQTEARNARDEEDDDDDEEDVVSVDDTGRFVTMVNAGKFPKVEVEYRADDFDHLRLRTEFYFEPRLRSYPFQRQTLPITLELASDVLRQTPSKLLCLLTPYSGFAPLLSSFSALENEDKVLSATADVGEAPRAPPFPACDGAPQFEFPRTRHKHKLRRSQLRRVNVTSTSEHNHRRQQTHLGGLYPCAPKRSTSRLSLLIVYEPPVRLGAMVLLPSGLIGAGALVSYALSDPVSRLQTLATSLLAAVVQHASIRAALPPRSVMTTADEFAFCVYAVIAVATTASFFVALSNSSEARKLAGCAGAASVIFFFHAKPPAGFDLDWRPALLIFAAIFFALALITTPTAIMRCVTNWFYGAHPSMRSRSQLRRRHTTKSLPPDTPDVSSTVAHTSLLEDSDNDDLDEGTELQDYSHYETSPKPIAHRRHKILQTNACTLCLQLELCCFSVARVSRLRSCSRQTTGYAGAIADDKKVSSGDDRAALADTVLIDSQQPRSKGKLKSRHLPVHYEERTSVKTPFRPRTVSILE